MTVPHYNSIEVGVSEAPTSVRVQRLNDEGIGLGLMQCAAYPPGEGQSPVGREERAIQSKGPGVTKERPHPVISAMRGGLRVTVGEVKTMRPVLYLQVLGHELDAEFLREVLLVPGIVVAQQIRDGNPPIAPRGNYPLKTHEPLRDEMSVLDVPVEYVAEQIKVIDPIGVSLQTLDEGILFGAFVLSRPPSKVHVGDEQDHGVGRICKKTTEKTAKV